MDPAGEYGRRRQAREATLALADRRFDRVSNLRVACFFAAIAAGWLAHHAGASVLWGSPFVIGYLVFVMVHERVERGRRHLRRAIAYYARGERRLAGSWIDAGDTGLALVPPTHPYALDVDAFGRGSLFELLSEARTRSGEEMLATWLLRAAPRDEVKARQAAVIELARAFDLREELALHALEARAELQLDDLRAWCERPALLQDKRLRVLAWLVTVTTLGSALAWLAFGAPIYLLIVASAFAALLTDTRKRDVAEVSTRITDALHELRALMHVLACFAGRDDRAPWLAERYARFAGAEAALARLVRLIDWLESRRNQVFAPFAYLVMWTHHFAFALEDWRKRHGRDVLAWLRTAGELEAIAALSRHTFEHPTDCFPELVDGAPQLVAEDAGHPLMPAGACVVNTVALAEPLRMLLVSGSNMSGKSTLLRTLGLNVVLALAGAPVRARRFVLTPLQIAATLRVQDSLHEGASRFFAEIARLKIVADCAAADPTLFLLDEILSGTNSHDRRIGTEAVVRSLLARGAIGLVTSHDLALTEIVGSLGAQAENVHFEDQMTGTTLAFDYKMRSGVVQKSNAIALMRAVGLEV